jgi:hypothetical protein
VVILHGLATLVFPASQSLDRQLVAVLTFSAFYLLFLIKQKGLSWYWLGLIGLLMGWTAITDYPTGLILAGLFVYAFFIVQKKQHLLLLMATGALPVLLAMVYNYSIFHTPLPAGYFHSELYTDLHYTGFLSLTYPKLDALWGLTFSPFRGLFYRSPFLLLAIPGLWYLGQERRYRAEFLMCLWAIVSFFAFNSSSAMWWGGNRAGPTYLTPMIPYLTIPVAYCLYRWVQFRWQKVLVGALAFWSFLFVWIETLGGQQFPELVPNPIWTVSLPAFLEGDIARNMGILLGLQGFASLLPLFILYIIIIYFIAYPPQLVQPKSQLATQEA